MADELENTPCALMGEAMARYKHDELTAGEAVSIILEQAKRLSRPMEAVAWRWRWPDTNKWHYADYNLHPEAEEVQALAVIPTKGLGSSSPKSEDTHRVTETAVVDTQPLRAYQEKDGLENCADCGEWFSVDMSHYCRDSDNLDAEEESK